ncbi:MAG: AMP-binding protein, partial [Gemmatimonadales bacterium]|nr:AMP-binding protein [Gemmatimonadales bacterium]
ADVDAWAARLLRAVDASQLTVGQLFRHRARTYAAKTLFELPGGRALTWHEVSGRLDTLTRGLMALGSTEPVTPIAILSDNRLEMALLDLACLSAGLVDVMVPANATDADVGFILRHAKVRTVFVSGKEQLHKVRKNREQLPDLARIVSFEAVDDRDVLSFAQVQALAPKTALAALEAQREAVRLDDLATVMYTSGTTGMP